MGIVISVQLNVAGTVAVHTLTNIGSGQPDLTR